MGFRFNSFPKRQVYEILKLLKHRDVLLLGIWDLSFVIISQYGSSKLG